MANYWQVAAGSEGRDYSADFITYGLAFVGGEANVASMLNVKTGDRVLLKKGMSKLLAVGVAVERNGVCAGKDDKEWLFDFDGWALPGYCNVDWYCPTQPIDAAGFTRTPMQQVHVNSLKNIAENALQTWPRVSSNISEPEPTKDVADSELLDILIQEGLRPAAAEDVAAALQRIRLLVRYYTRFAWQDVNESEVRAFLVAPLLLALGWPEQNLKCELQIRSGRVDVACFAKPYRRDGKGEFNSSDGVR